jgi:hypothetical protein
MDRLNPLLRSIIDPNEDQPGGFVAAGKLTVEKAFEVYQKAYVARLSEALGESFETVWKYLGDEDFFEVCEVFIRQHPSTEWDLNAFGKEFPEFLRPLAVQNEVPFLHDLAIIDLNFNCLFHQKESPPTMKTEELSSLIANDPTLPVKIAEHRLFFESKYPVYDLWLAIKDDQPWPEQQGSQTVLLYKKNDQVFLKRVEPLERELIDAIGEQGSVAKGIEVWQKLNSVNASDLDLVETTKGIIQFLLVSSLLRLRPLE